jgi:ketosteroid isomerase-like protein
MKHLTVSLFVLLVFTASVSFGSDERIGMKTNNHREEEKKILMDKDREMAKASSEKGILTALYSFMTGDAVLLPEKGRPICGKNTCEKLMKPGDIKEREGQLQWEPLFADVSAAGDLGYTHGRFERPAADSSDNKKINYGYYATIWQKDDRDNWKVAFSQGLLLLKDLEPKPIDKKIDWEKTDEKTREVVTTERSFAQYSLEKGTPAAFYHFIADTGIALSAGGPPQTKETYAKIITAQQGKKPNTPKSTLEWEPVFSYVAASGDMAYNYGPYKYTATDANGNQQTGYGYFVTVWKKQPDNRWKFVLDAGNVSPPNPFFASGGQGGSFRENRPPKPPAKAFD